MNHFISCWQKIHAASLDHNTKYLMPINWTGEYLHKPAAKSWNFVETCMTFKLTPDIWRINSFMTEVPIMYKPVSWSAEQINGSVSIIGSSILNELTHFSLSSLDPFFHWNDVFCQALLMMHYAQAYLWKTNR